MAVLTEDQKLEIVLKLARFRGHCEIAEELSVEGVVVAREQVRQYDPTCPKFDAGEKWKLIFIEARRAFVEEVAAIPLANQSYRMELLQRGVDQAIKEKKWGTAASLAEQGAREIGGILTNQRNLTVDNRGRARDLTPEERRDMLVAMLDDARGKRPTEEGTKTVQ